MLFFAAMLGAMLDPIALVVLALAALVSRPWWGMILAIAGLVAGGYYLRQAGGGGFGDPGYATMVGFASLVGYSITGFGMWFVKDRLWGRRGEPKPLHRTVEFETSAPPEDGV